MTDVLGQTEGGIKATIRDPRILPETVIYDVDHTMALPGWLSGISGINAIAHAVEALYAADGNPRQLTRCLIWRSVSEQRPRCGISVCQRVALIKPSN